MGSLPKAFKIIPNLRNWEEVLYLTDPDMWSEHACYAATKLFVSNLNARLAQVGLVHACACTGARAGGQGLVLFAPP